MKSVWVSSFFFDFATWRKNQVFRTVAASAQVSSCAKNKLITQHYLYFKGPSFRLHYYSSQLPDISAGRKKLHEKCYRKLKSLWLGKGVSPEVLIYCTTYYSEGRSHLEKDVLKQYVALLDTAFEFYKDKEARVIPRFEVK